MQPSRSTLFSLAAAAICAAGASAQTLVKDINTTPDPARNPSSKPRSFAAPAGANWMVFTAERKGYGRELFVRTGTGQTRLLKDIRPGAASSSPSQLTAGGGHVYFVANNGTHGPELWRTNGTTAGTSMFYDLRPGSAGSSPTGLVYLSGSLWFAADNGSYGREPWTLTGNTLRQVKNIASGSGSSFPSRFMHSGGYVYFSANDGKSGYELWRSRGTSATTYRVHDIYPGSGSSSPDGMVAFQGRIFFVATHSQSGRELWSTDGTSAGTRIFRDIVAGARSSSPRHLTRIGNGLVFSAHTPNNGRELWQTRGSVFTTWLLKDIRSGSLGSNPDQFYSSGRNVWFTADNGSWGRELYRVYATSSGGALQVGSYDLRRGSAGSSPSEFLAFNGYLYVVYDDGTHGAELWSGREPFATAPMSLGLKNLRHPGASAPRNLRVIHGNVVFAANDGIHGEEVFRVQGSSDPILWAEAALTPPGFSLSSHPTELTGVGDQVYFFARKSKGKAALFRSGSSRASVRELKELYPSPVAPASFVQIDGRVYFSAKSPRGDTELFETDGTPAGTRMVADIHPGRILSGGNVTGYRSSRPRDLTVFGGRLFFIADRGTTYQEFGSDVLSYDPRSKRLYRHTGAGASGVAPRDLVRAGGRLFFSADDGTGRELWSSDGTNSALVYDDRLQIADPKHLVAVGSGIVYSAQGRSGRELWESDGTAAGTRMVADLAPGPASSSPGSLVADGNTVYFTAVTPSTGQEVFIRRPDGKVRLLKDIGPGAASSGATGLTLAPDGTLFFTAITAVHGRELYASAGTAASTRMVADLVTGAGQGSNPSELVAPGDGMLYFRALTPATGIELWRVPEDLSSPPKVLSIHPGTGHSEPGQLTAAGQNLFFVAQDGKTGYELWTLPIGARRQILGAGCRAGGSRGQLATLRTDPPRIGQSFVISGTHLNPRTIGMLAIGLPGAEPTPFLHQACLLQLDPRVPFVLIPALISGSSWSWQGPVPGTTALLGKQLGLQLAMPGAGGTTDLSNGVRLTLGR